MVECCFTSTETVGLLGTGAQDGHFDFHTAPELYCEIRSNVGSSSNSSSSSGGGGGVRVKDCSASAGRVQCFSLIPIYVVVSNDFFFSVSHFASL